MQPRPENDLLYLLRILEGIEKIQLYSAGLNDPFHFFEANEGKDSDACLMQLAHWRAGRKRSETLRTNHKEIDWKQVKSFRNRIVHDYSGLDRFISYEIIKKHLPQLKEALENIIVSEVHSGTFIREEWLIAQTSPYLRHVAFAELNRKIDLKNKNI